MLSLDTSRVRFMIRYHKQLNEQFRYVCAVFHDGRAVVVADLQD